MAAHSACDFGGGKAERLALAKYRQVLWQGRVLNSQFTDEELRNQGRCPLTPEEIGLLLAALGFDNNTRLYLASHKVLHDFFIKVEILCNHLTTKWFISFVRFFSFNSGNRCLLLGLLGSMIFNFLIFQVYGGEARISTLRKLFPLMEDKKSLASVEKRAKVEGKASLLAAVDYYVSMQSNIFISASPGNMHNALVSISRFFFG